MARKPKAKTGLFVVDLSALNLPQATLSGIDRAIKATVQKQLGATNLRAKLVGAVPQNPPPWWGIIYIPPPNPLKPK